MHGHINVKSPNNINKWQMGFNSAFKGLNYIDILNMPISAIELFREIKWDKTPTRRTITFKKFKRFLFIHLYTAQHVSGTVVPIIRSLSFTAHAASVHCVVSGLILLPALFRYTWTRLEATSNRTPHSEKRPRVQWRKGSWWWAQQCPKRVERCTSE
jgi:hypothetical protein